MNTDGAQTDPGGTAPPPHKTVVVVGRPNVGKSTLVNRILGRREAIVEERPGVTRDRKAVEVEWLGRSFTLVDTGGWIATRKTDTIDAKVSAQSERALADADLVLFVVDATVGVTDEDREAAKVVHRSGRPAMVVVNKVDNDGREVDAWEFAALGLGDPHPVSALHGRRAGDLLDDILEALGSPEPDVVDEGDAQGAGAASDEPPAVAIVGRPNVGKSTLFNALCGDERSVVHDMPGTTRDSVDTLVETDSGPLRLLDTAGMRRRARIDDGPEYFSMLRALETVDRADVVLLVLDASAGVTNQDQRLAERVDAAGCAVVVVMNKWDLLDTDQRLALRAQIADELPFLAYAPSLKASALSKMGVFRIWPAIDEALAAHRERVPTRKLNEVIEAAQAAHPPPSGRILYATQGATHPPTITLFTNRELPPHYLRYIERKLREAIEFGPAPIKLRVRPRAS